MTQNPTQHTIDKGTTIDGLASVWVSMRELLGGLDPDDWARDTALPGWDVQANVAHVIGTELMLLGEAAPEEHAGPADGRPDDHVRNDIGRFNEVWVRSLAHRSPAEVLELFDDVTRRRLELLRSMPLEEWDAESFTPAGRDTYGRFMRIRVFDCWFHEQDIREAVGRPGHEAGPAVSVALDELVTALGFVVGKRAGAPSGTTVTFELTGPAGRTVHVRVDERAHLVQALDGPATVTIVSPVVPFTRLCGGRTDVAAVRDDVSIDGDVELGEKILANLNYTV